MPCLRYSGLNHAVTPHNRVTDNLHAANRVAGLIPIIRAFYFGSLSHGFINLKIADQFHHILLIYAFRWALHIRSLLQYVSRMTRLLSFLMVQLFNAQMLRELIKRNIPIVMNMEFFKIWGQTALKVALKVQSGLSNTRGTETPVATLPLMRWTSPSI